MTTQQAPQAPQQTPIAALVANCGTDKPTWVRLVRVTGEAVTASERAETKWQTAYTAAIAHFGTLATWDESFGGKGATARTRTVQQSINRKAFIDAAIAPNLPQALRDAMLKLPIDTRSKTGKTLWDSLSAKDKAEQEKLKDERKDYSTRVSVYMDRIRASLPEPESEAQESDAQGEAQESEASMRKDATAKADSESVTGPRVPLLTGVAIQLVQALKRVQTAEGDSLGKLDAVVFCKHLNACINMLSAAGVQIDVLGVGTPDDVIPMRASEKQ